MAKKFDITKMAMAAGGGVAARIATNQVEAFQVKQGKEPDSKMTGAIVSALGAAIVYFGGDKYAPVGYGMIGSGVGEAADDVINDMTSSVQGSANRLGTTQRAALAAKVQELRKRMGKPSRVIDIDPRNVRTYDQHRNPGGASRTGGARGYTGYSCAC